MSYTRNTGSTLGAAASHLIVVDDTNALVDIGSVGSTPVKGANASLGTDTWGGITYPVITTATHSPEAGFVAADGISWASGNPTFGNGAAGDSVVCIAAIGTSSSGNSAWYSMSAATNSGYPGLLRNGGAFLHSPQGTSTGVTPAATDFSVKVCAGVYYKSGATPGQQAFIDVAGGSKNALDLDIADPGFANSNQDLTIIGGFPGQGFQQLRIFAFAVFKNRKLTLAEYQTLRDSWFSTLIVASGGIFRSRPALSGGMRELTGGV